MSKRRKKTPFIGSHLLHCSPIILYTCPSLKIKTNSYVDYQSNTVKEPVYMYIFMHSNWWIKILPEDVGSWYCLFKNLEASESFLWHKTRNKVWASSQHALPCLLVSITVEMSSLAVINIWIKVSVCKIEGTLCQSIIQYTVWNTSLYITITRPEWKTGSIIAQQSLLLAQLGNGEGLLHQLQRSPRE